MDASQEGDGEATSPDVEQVSKKENLHLRTPENSSLTGGEREETSTSSEIEVGCSTWFRTQSSEQPDPGRRDSLFEDQTLSEATSGGTEVAERGCDENSVQSSGPLQRKSVQRKKKTHKCPHCGRSLSSSVSLSRHIQRAHICSDCGKNFSSTSDLSVHKKSHKEEKQYQCAECRKIFAFKSFLVRHEKSHIGGKPYTCPDCGKGFSSESGLRAHHYYHKEKPHQCAECGERFPFRSMLFRHESTHTEEKPYTCSDCGKGFTYNSDLLAHKKIPHWREPI